MLKKITQILVLGVVLHSLSFANSSLLERTEFSGSFKTFYEMIDRKGSPMVHRERMCFKYGFKTKIDDNFTFVAGFATGGAGSRTSNNQSFTNAFDTKGFGLDIAYLKYKYCDWLKFKLGKLSNKTIYHNDDLLWDGDLAFEGQALYLKKKIGDSKLSLNAGYFILNEVSETRDNPYMTFLQPVIKTKCPLLNYEFGCAYYAFNNISGIYKDKNNATQQNLSTNANTRTASGNLMYQYNTINPTLKITHKIKDTDYMVSGFADYVYNNSSKDEGYLFGVKFGDSKINKLGAWQVYYNWRYLELDAWLDIFPDASAYSGRTDVKGHEIVLTFGLTEKVFACIDYYNTKKISTNSNEEQILQTNLGVKF